LDGCYEGVWWHGGSAVIGGYGCGNGGNGVCGGCLFSLDGDSVVVGEYGLLWRYFGLEVGFCWEMIVGRCLGGTVEVLGGGTWYSFLLLVVM